MKLEQLTWSDTSVIPKWIWDKLSEEKKLHYRTCDLYDLPLATTPEDLNSFIRLKNEKLQAKHRA